MKKSYLLNIKQPVTIITDKYNNLCFQFSSEYSKQYFGIKQKYISFGAKDTPENRVEAQETKNILILHLTQDKFNLSELEQYKHKSKRKKAQTLTEDNNLTFSEIYQKYVEYKLPTLGKTMRANYQVTFTNLFSQAPQDINQQLEMRNYLIKNRGPSTVVKALGLIACCLEWAKQERLIPEDFTINYREYAQRYKKGSEMKNLRRKKPKLVEGKSQNHSKIAWTKEERDLIIKTYYARDRRQFKYQFDYLSRAIELLFLTGLRISEMTALRWKQISKDFSFIRIDDTYLPRIKEFKGNTKNYKTREVPCSPRVKEILKELIDFRKTEESFVFLNVVGNPLNVNNIFTSWGGQMRNGKQGIVVKLFLDGKLPAYIEPYSTRRTFVSVQVRKFDATTVAAWVGDNPMTIFTHYCYKDETAVPTE